MCWKRPSTGLSRGRSCRTATANSPGRRCCENSIGLILLTRTSSYLAARRLALHRVDLDLAQATEPQYLHLQRPADTVAIERADQIVDAVDADAVEPDHDITGQQPCPRRRSIRLDL